MERYNVDLEMPVKFVISEIVYCLVLYRAIAFWRAAWLDAGRPPVLPLALAAVTKSMGEEGK